MGYHGEYRYIWNHYLLFAELGIEHVEAVALNKFGYLHTIETPHCHLELLCPLLCRPSLSCCWTADIFRIVLWWTTLVQVTVMNSNAIIDGYNSTISNLINVLFGYCWTILWWLKYQTWSMFTSGTVEPCVCHSLPPHLSLSLNPSLYIHMDMFMYIYKCVCSLYSLGSILCFD